MVDVKNLLVTGYPGTGKTTLIRTVASSLAHLNPVGFYTEEIRNGKLRAGFQLVDLSGHRQILSHVDVAGKFRVGKYGVDVEGFERYLTSLDWPGRTNKLVVVDEIGRMECLSRRFVALMRSILDSSQPVLATVAMKGQGLISEIKQRPDVRLFELTLANRDQLPDRLVADLTKLLHV